MTSFQFWVSEQLCVQVGENYLRPFLLFVSLYIQVFYFGISFHQSIYDGLFLHTRERNLKDFRFICVLNRCMDNFQLSDVSEQRSIRTQRQAFKTCRKNQECLQTFKSSLAKKENKINNGYL